MNNLNILSDDKFKIRLEKDEYAVMSDECIWIRSKDKDLIKKMFNQISKNNKNTNIYANLKLNK